MNVRMLKTMAALSRTTAFVLIMFAAFMATGPALPAQAGGDGLEPFLGTWSGIFTTQDNDFWQLEDFLCFAGCSPEAHDHMRALLDDPANDDRSINELLGESWAFEAENIMPMLTGEGRLIQKENGPDNDPKLHCQPYGYVREVTNPLPFIIRRDGRHLIFEYEEWSLLRTVYMDGRAHPEHRTPSLLGHAVGRIEDGALIIETTRVTPDRYSDFTEGGHSGELTGIERFTVHDNPRRLELELTLTDPVTLTRPYTLKKVWLATPEVKLVKDRCGAIPGKF